MNTEPWHENSTVSSPVKDFGARNTVAMTSSMAESPSMTVPKCAVCVAAAERLFPEGEMNTLPAICKASGPLIRMTDIAPIPAGVERAAMVSSFMFFIVLNI